MYKRTYWRNHVTEKVNVFLPTENADGTLTLTPVDGKTIQEGTPQNETNFNNMETGILSTNIMGLEMLRQMQHMKQELSGLEGTKIVVTLTNSKRYPLNNSKQTVTIPAANRRNSLDYRIETEVVSATGEVGHIRVSEKLLNGFKIAYTGSASEAVINCYIVGGI